jgi:hypothetical protein
MKTERLVQVVGWHIMPQVPDGVFFKADLYNIVTRSASCGLISCQSYYFYLN